MKPSAYPTPAQVSVFLGDVWLDDAFRLEMRYQNPQIPLYGFNEAEFTAVAQGKRIVQGSLIINFRYPEYLRTAMEGIGYRAVEQDNAVDFMNRLRQADVAERIAMLEEARMQGVGKDVKPIFIDEFAKKPGVDGIGFETNSQGNTQIGQTLESSMRIPVEEELTFKIFFDTPEASEYHWRVEGVHLVGEAMTISNQAQGGDASASGMPLYELYSFFARRVTTVMRKNISFPDEENPEEEDMSVIDTSGILSPWLRRNVL